jgi:hypothetical protein
MHFPDTRQHLYDGKKLTDVSLRSPQAAFRPPSSSWQQSPSGRSVQLQVDTFFHFQELEDAGPALAAAVQKECFESCLNNLPNASSPKLLITFCRSEAFLNKNASHTAANRNITDQGACLGMS